MKVTRELTDNGQKIIHVNYEKEDIEKIKEQMKKNIERKLDS